MTLAKVYTQQILLSSEILVFQAEIYMYSSYFKLFIMVVYFPYLACLTEGANESCQKMALSEGKIKLSHSSMVCGF